MAEVGAAVEVGTDELDAAVVVVAELIAVAGDGQEEEEADDDDEEADRLAVELEAEAVGELDALLLLDDVDEGEVEETADDDDDELLGASDDE